MATGSDKERHEMKGGAPEGWSRRDFLRVSGVAAAAAGLTTAGCQVPVENVVPFDERPEGLRTPGRPRFYATAVDGAPLTVRTREGRPIHVTPNRAHPEGARIALRHFASILDLYDPARAQHPLSVRRSLGSPVQVGWDVALKQVADTVAQSQGKVALLTGHLDGAAERAAVAAFAKATGASHVSWEPIEADNVALAWRHCFGDSPVAPARLERADLILGFGAEFLDDPMSGMEPGFAARRTPDAEGGMSRFVQLEGRLSLTGAAADKRIRLVDSRLPVVALAILRELTITHGLGTPGTSPGIQVGVNNFTPLAAQNTTGIPEATIKGLAAELAEKKGKAVAIAGGTASTAVGGLALEIAVHAINATLGSLSTVFDWHAGLPVKSGGTAALAQLVADMKSGKVAALLVGPGANPIYAAPAELGFAEALAKVGRVVSMSDRLDETALHADYLLPTSHPFECWSDAGFGGGVHSVQQPVIRPLYETHGFLDVILALGAAAGAGGDVAAAVTAGVPKEGADPLAEQPVATSAAYHYLRGYWGKTFFGAAPGGAGFERQWEDALRQGWWQAPRKLRSWSFRAAALAALGKVEMASPKGIELCCFPHSALWDGRSGNNGWLYELPDPLTRVTWGDWVAISPELFEKNGLSNGDLVRVGNPDSALWPPMPAYRQAGMAPNQVALPLGFGRTAVGKVGNGVGNNLLQALGLAGGAAPRAGLNSAFLIVGGNQPLAITQGADVMDRSQRQLLPVATLAEVSANPAAGTEQPEIEGDIWPDYPYETNRWEMAIDLSRCNGCGKCVLSCQAENNIPVVGKKGCIEGREMSWMRIDRYYDAPPRRSESGGGEKWGDEVWEGPREVVDDPVTVFEPMLCQHCERAPCETVCPFIATMHSEDGLNQQIYNRCAGTRYCANNCPFKVRRFNWFEYSEAHDAWPFRWFVPELSRHADLNVRGRMQMKNNPEVTVRSRGVMEKCSFCVQRIREARAQATREGRAGKLKDGEVTSACAEACPTGAIVFGDVNDPNSRVRALATSPRAMRLLKMLNIRPAVSYLTKVRNDNV